MGFSLSSRSYGKSIAAMLTLIEVQEFGRMMDHADEIDFGMGFLGFCLNFLGDFGDRLSKFEH